MVERIWRSLATIGGAGLRDTTARSTGPSCWPAALVVQSGVKL